MSMQLLLTIILMGGMAATSHSQTPGQVQMKVQMQTGAASVKGAEKLAPSEPAPVTEVFSSDSSALGSLLTEEIIRGLRDPFAPPLEVTKKIEPQSELETIRLGDLRLNGVITGPKKLRAMISAPGNKTYFVAVGDRLGLRQGRVTAIQNDLIKIVEYEEDEKGRKVPEVFELRLSGELVSLSKQEDE